LVLLSSLTTTGSGGSIPAIMFTKSEKNSRTKFRNCTRKAATKKATRKSRLRPNSPIRRVCRKLFP
jgi:hypothetical protein